MWPSGGGGIKLHAALAGRHKQTSKPLYQLISSYLFILHSSQWSTLATKHAFYSFVKFPSSWFPFRLKFSCPPFPSPPSGDSTVSVGEGVPGACLLPPPHGPGGAVPVAGPDDALSVGQHDRPGEADPVSPGVCHRPQVRTGSRSSVGALSLTLYDNISQRVNSYFGYCLCLSCNLFYSHIINASLLLLDRKSVV